VSKIAAYSANALLAKARAMYGDILTSEDYAELANCRSTQEFLNYLKNRTAYEMVLKDLPNVQMSRARLEAMLMKYRQMRIASLAANEKALGGHLYKIMLLQYDMNVLLQCAENLGTSNFGEYLGFAPDFFKNNCRLPVAKLEAAKDFDDLYAALADTPYGRLLDAFKTGKLKFGVRVLLPLLHDYVAGQTEQIIKKDYPEKEQEALLDIIRMRSDMTTIEGLYRLKKYFPQVHPKESAFLISHVTALSEKELDALLAAENTEELTALLQKTRYGKLLDFSSEEIIEKKTRRALLRQDEKNLRFSTYPQVTLLSYIGILNVENTNLTHISEGIGYKETPEEILKYLIVQDN